MKWTAYTCKHENFSLMLLEAKAYRLWNEIWEWKFGDFTHAQLTTVNLWPKSVELLTTPSDIESHWVCKKKLNFLTWITVNFKSLILTEINHTSSNLISVTNRRISASVTVPPHKYRCLLSMFSHLSKAAYNFVTACKGLSKKIQLVG